jgi:hypothetical protein
MKRESEQRNKITFSVVRWYKQAFTFQQQITPRDLLGKAVKCIATGLGTFQTLFSASPVNCLNVVSMAVEWLFDGGSLAVTWHNYCQ